MIEVPKTPPIGRLRNNWRRRDVTIYEHPDDPNKVVTVGKPFNGDPDVVCEEPRGAYEWAIVLHPKIVTYD